MFLTLRKLLIGEKKSRIVHVIISHVAMPLWKLVRAYQGSCRDTSYLSNYIMQETLRVNT